MKQIFTLITFLCLAYGLLAQSMTVNTFSDAIHNAGAGTATQSSTFSFPTDVSTYNQVLMHIDLNCPPNGCDPWDRYANISVVKNDGSTVEIGRYITPYGIGTCGWTLDVSDYREMLRGEVTLRSGIETFSGGWSLNLDFEFVEGTQDYAYINIQNLWYGFDSGSSRNYSNYHVGDTLWTLDNLPARTVTIPTNAEQVIFKVNNTGHGQGNTLNAAEFRPVNHMIRVNGQTTHVHDMWKNDCGQNPCSPQNGNWEYGRAGWCPGQEVAAVDFDITDHITPGQDVVLDYMLDPYLNRCSPLYPYCEPADDCAFGTQIGCGYDGQLHTPPTYKMAIQLIIKSSSPLTSIDEVANWSNFSVFPNPSNGNFNVNVTFDEPQQALINIIDTTGKNVFQQSPSPTLHLNETLNLSQLSSGMYFLEVQTNEGSTFKKIIIN